MDKVDQYRAANLDHEIALAIARGDGVPRDLKLAKELFVKQWRDWQDNERCRSLAIWGLVYIGYLPSYAVQEGLDEKLIEELSEEEDYWLGDDGCPGENVPNWGLALSGLKSKDCWTDEELERYLIERRKTFKGGGVANPAKGQGKDVKKWNPESWHDIMNKPVAETIREMDRGKVMNGLILFGEFVKRVDGLRFHLIENWCLCKYCQLYDLTNKNFSRWADEYDACVKYLRGLKIKGGFDKRRIIFKMLVEDYDYNQEGKVLFVIRERFVAECLNYSEGEKVVAANFVKSIDDLIHSLAADHE